MERIDLTKICSLSCILQGMIPLSNYKTVKAYDYLPDMALTKTTRKMSETKSITKAITWQSSTPVVSLKHKLTERILKNMHKVPWYR